MGSGSTSGGGFFDGGVGADASIELDGGDGGTGDGSGGTGGAGGFGGTGGMGTGGMGTGGQGGTGGINPCPDGTPCVPADLCKPTGVCMGGMCMGTSTCKDVMVPQCHASECIQGQGCVPVPLSGVSCSDGNACSQVDTCSNGVCVSGSAVTCVPPDPCLENGICDPQTGTCSFSSKGNGTLCGGGVNDCVSGTCSNGACSGTNKPPGTACDDSNACTTSDACAGNKCVGTPVACPLDQCDQAAVCNQGQCQYADKLDGAPCDDGNACTLIDSCQVGACSGSSPVECPDPAPCFEPGICDPQTGQCSSVPVADDTLCGFAPGDCIQGGVCKMGVCNAQPDADGTGCDDKNPCSTNDTCKMGACSGLTTLDGVPCPGGGTCVAGSCFPEPQGSGSGGDGGAGGGSGGGSGVGGAGGVQGDGGTGASGSNSDDRARLHGGACGVVGSPGLVGGALGSAAAGIGFVIALFARRRRRAS